MQQLRYLELTDTPITDDGLEHLAGLHQLNWLSVGPSISRNAARNLKKSLPKCSIAKYAIDGTGFHE